MTRRIDPDALLDRTEHRPWPLPDRPWLMTQSWQDQLFAHWRIDPLVMRNVVPPALALDLFDGSAWLGLTPFLLSQLRFRNVLSLPTAHEFPELNLRTYVTAGGRAGVFFFSLDAASLLAVLGARTTFRLPYHHAHMSISTVDGWTLYQSQRRRAAASFRARYRATSPATANAAPGTLDHFLVERYALYVMHGRRLMRGDIHHPPWVLQPAAARIESNTIAAAAGLHLPPDPPLLHYSRRQDTLIWAPSPVA